MLKSPKKKARDEIQKDKIKSEWDYSATVFATLKNKCLRILRKKISSIWNSILNSWI